MSAGRLYIVSAPSGAGKTSLTRALVPNLAERGIRVAISVSYTTRAPRPGEQDGVHYHFISEPEFLAMVAGDEFLEHAEVFGRRYGTGRAKTAALLATGTQVLLDIDWQGGRQVRQRAPTAVGIFILPPSLDDLERRLRGRGQDSAATIQSRMQQARAEIAHCPEYQSVLVNDDFERALATLVDFFEGSGVLPRPTDPQVASLLQALLAV